MPLNSSRDFKIRVPSEGHVSRCTSKRSPKSRQRHRVVIQFIDFIKKIPVYAWLVELRYKQEHQTFQTCLTMKTNIRALPHQSLFIVWSIPRIPNTRRKKCVNWKSGKRKKNEEQREKDAAQKGMLDWYQTDFGSTAATCVYVCTQRVPGSCARARASVWNLRATR